MNVRRPLAAFLLSAMAAAGLVAANASSASATVNDWTPSAPVCTNQAHGSWYDFSELATSRPCSPGSTEVHSATRESATVYLDLTITRWRYSGGWQRTTVSSKRYSARCGNVNVSTLQLDNGDCNSAYHYTWWRGAYHCLDTVLGPACGNIWESANAPLFEVPRGTIYQVEKRAWWLSGGKWVPKTVTFWINDGGFVYSTQYS